MKKESGKMEALKKADANAVAFGEDAGRLTPSLIADLWKIIEQGRREA